MSQQNNESELVNPNIIHSGSDLHAVIRFFLATQAVGLNTVEGIENKVRSELIFEGDDDRQLCEQMFKTGIHEIKVDEVAPTKISGLVVGKRWSGWPFPYPVPRRREPVFSMHLKPGDNTEGATPDDLKKRKIREFGNMVWNMVDRSEDVEAGKLYKELLRSGDSNIKHHFAIGPGWIFQMVPNYPDRYEIIKQDSQYSVWFSDVLARGIWGDEIRQDCEVE